MPLLKETFGTIEGDIEVGVERLVGTFKINGTVYNRYVKVIDMGTLVGGTASSPGVTHKPHGITNLVDIISLHGMAKTLLSTSYVHITIPYIDPSTLSGGLRLDEYQGEIRILAYSSNFSAYTGLVTIEYYK